MASIMITIGKLAEGGKPYLEKYAEIVMPLLHANGAKIHGRYAGVEALIGKDYPDLVAVMEFQDSIAMAAFLDSSEYAAAITYRKQAFRQLCTFACEHIQ